MIHRTRLDSTAEWQGSDGKEPEHLIPPCRRPLVLLYRPEMLRVKVHLVKLNCFRLLDDLVSQRKEYEERLM